MILYKSVLETQGKSQVLIVDDDYSVRSMLSRLFTFEGFVVQVAVDGAEALTYMKAHCPDLVLLDYNLPGDNGLKVLDNLRGRCPKTRVIVITGTDDPEVETGARRAGAEFLSKPLAVNELLSRAKSLTN